MVDTKGLSPLLLSPDTRCVSGLRQLALKITSTLLCKFCSTNRTLQSWPAFGTFSSFFGRLHHMYVNKAVLTQRVAVVAADVGHFRGVLRSFSGNFFLTAPSLSCFRENNKPLSTPSSPSSPSYAAVFHVVRGVGSKVI